MRQALCVPEKMVGPLRAFLKAQRIPLRVAAGGDGPVHIVWPAKRRRSTSSVLYARGWIACPVARSLAPALGIKMRQVGAILDRLDIRIRACDLGCF